VLRESRRVVPVSARVVRSRNERTGLDRFALPERHALVVRQDRVRRHGNRRQLRGGVARRTERGTETNHIRGMCNPIGETHDETSYSAFITRLSPPAAPLAVAVVVLE